MMSQTFETFINIWSYSKAMADKKKNRGEGANIKICVALELKSFLDVIKSIVIFIII